MLLLWIVSACMLIAVFVWIRVLLLVVTVENQSMSPTLEDGDRVLVMRYWPKRWLRKEYIVVVWPTGFTPGWRRFDSESPFIKRIIGLPGDTLVTTLDELDEVHREREAAAHNDAGRRTWIVPAHHVFVRGDHPIGGWDSLSWGPVPVQNVIGVVIKKLPRRTVSHLQSKASQQSIAKEGPPEGIYAPPFTARTLQGHKVSLTTYAGSSVVFLFMWPCGPCRSIMQEIEAVRGLAAHVGVELVLVSFGQISETQAFVHELGITMPVTIAPRLSNSFMRDYNVISVPSFCLIDACGRVQSTGYPSRSWGSWKTLIDSWTVNGTSKLQVSEAEATSPQFVCNDIDG